MNGSGNCPLSFAPRHRRDALFGDLVGAGVRRRRPGARGPVPRVRAAEALCALLLASPVGGVLPAPAGGELAAQEPSPGRPVVRDSNGVTIVLGTGVDRPLGWTVEPILRLGNAFGPPETSFYRLTPYSVAVASDGRIVVLNRGNHRVVVFSPDGEPLAAFGEDGPGPGEMRNPVSVWIAPSGRIRVLDWATGILTYQADGTFVSDDTEARGAMGLGQRVEETPSGTVLTWEIGARSDTGSVEQVRLATPTDTLVLGEWRKRPAHSFSFDTCRLRIQWAPLFEPYVAWDAEAGRIAVLSGFAYDIAVFDADGHWTRSVRRAVEPRRLTRDDALARLGPHPAMRVSGGQRCDFDPEDLVERRGFYALLQPVGRLTLSPDGHLWARRTAPRVGSGTSDEAGAIDVFDPGGVYAGTLPAATPFPLVFIDEDRFVTIETDELDVEHVVVYRVSRR